jgi:hypothetical protein
MIMAEQRLEGNGFALVPKRHLESSSFRQFDQEARASKTE